MQVNEIILCEQKKFTFFHLLLLPTSAPVAPAAVYMHVGPAPPYMPVAPAAPNVPVAPAYMPVAPACPKHLNLKAEDYVCTKVDVCGVDNEKL